MAAIAEQPVPLMATKAGQRAKASVLARAKRWQATNGSYRCICCGGRCNVEVEYATTGAIEHSKGQCRTAGCIAWEE